MKVLLMRPSENSQFFQFRFLALRMSLDKSPISLVDLSVAKHAVETLQSLGGARKITSPDTGRSIRCTTPQNTFPGLSYFLRIYSFTVSDSGMSPVLSPARFPRPSY